MFMLIFSLASPIDNSQTEMAEVFFGKQFFFSNLLGRLENADIVFFFIEWLLLWFANVRHTHTRNRYIRYLRWNVENCRLIL